MDVQCGVSSWWEHHLCVFRLVTWTSGPVRTCGGTQSMTGTGTYRTHITPEHTLGSQPLLSPIAAWLWLSRGICMGPSHRHLNIHIPQPPKLQSKETFVKESSAQTVPEETQPCDGFKHNSKATNTTTVGSGCQSTRCCCWKNCSAAMGSGLPCHRRQRRRRRREQELWAPALLVQKKKKK